MPARSSKPKLGTTRGLVETILRWFREIWSKYFLRQKRPASVLTTERRAESVAEQAGSIAAATENAAAEPKTAKSFAEPVTADVKVSSDAKISPIAHIVPDQQEIQRRRDLVRLCLTTSGVGPTTSPRGSRID